MFIIMLAFVVIAIVEMLLIVMAVIHEYTPITLC